MGFTIKNNQGVGVPLKELDQDACTLWNKAHDPKWWASPIQITPRPETFGSEDEEREWDSKNFKEISREMSNNWFDRVGYLIHEGADSWEKLREIYLTPYKKIVDKYKDSPDAEKVRQVIMEQPPVKPVLELIALWESKGYTPHPVKD